MGKDMELSYASPCLFVCFLWSLILWVDELKLVANPCFHFEDRSFEMVLVSSLSFGLFLCSYDVFLENWYGT